MSALARRKVALYLLFLAPGLGISSWVTRTPAIRDQIGASTAEMGMVLFGLSVGSMMGILSSGPLVLRIGTRRIIAVGMTSVVVSMPVIGLGAMTSSPIVVAVGLGLFGLGMGGSEIAMNVEGAEMERITRKPFLPLMHGFFSLGTVIGATAGIVFTAWDFSVAVHLGIVGGLTLAAFAWSIGKIPAFTNRHGQPESSQADVAPRAPAPHGGSLWKDSRLILISVIVLAMALAEGTANDWLPLVMVDEHHFDEALGSAVYAVFAASMTLGRFCGGPVIRSLGRARVLAGSAAFAAAGLALVSLTDHQVIAGLAVVLWGLGASLGFPLALSAAGDSGPNSAARVSFASIVGYLALLVGPPALGILGETVGLRGALLVPMAIVVLAIFFAPAAARPRSKLTRM